MEKKIGTFLMIMVIICAVLLLLATAGREPQPGTEPAATTAPTETGAEAETTAPPERAPETQATENEAAGDHVSERVREILDREMPDKTAVTPMARGTVQMETDAGGQQELSYVNSLAQLARERRMNPIAGFWELVSEGLYSKQKDDSGRLPVEVLDAPGREKKQYAYTDEGVRLLLTDLLALSAEMDDGLALETALLGTDGQVEAEQVHFAGDEDCRYAYFSCASEQATHILCFYLRADGAGEWITDVEFQLLNMRHASGDEVTLAQLSESFDQQAAALMAAAELLMTGQNRAAEGDVPFDYEVGGFDAAIGRFGFSGNAEQGTLTNYRLKKG